jgi:hypothetical protein
VYLLIVSVCFYVGYVLIDIVVRKYGVLLDKENRNRKLYNVVKRLRVVFPKIIVDEEDNKNK